MTCRMPAHCDRIQACLTQAHDSSCPYDSFAFRVWKSYDVSTLTVFAIHLMKLGSYDWSNRLRTASVKAV
jgi:hypothetical protein